MGRRPTLDSQLQELTTLTHRMAERVLKGLGILCQHLETPIPEEVLKLAVADGEVDDFEDAIDNSILQILATQQPLGQDLRFAHACAKIASFLERMGDAVESLARQFASHTPLRSRESILDMLKGAYDIYKRSYAAMFEEDVSQIRDIFYLDDKVDEYQRTLYLHAKDILRNQPTNDDVESALQLINISTRIEKLADLCCRWAEQIDFARHGFDKQSDPRKRYKVVFVDNERGLLASLAACLLAEAVGDIVDISVSTQSAEPPIRLLDHSEVLSRNKVTAYAFPVARIGTVHWQKVLLYIEIGKLSLPEDEVELIPYKAIRLFWPDSSHHSFDGSESVWREERVEEIVKELKPRVEKIARLVVRSQTRLA